MLGRRIFAAMLGSAPAMAASTVHYPPPPTSSMGGIGAALSPSEVYREPSTLKDFYKAQNEFRHSKDRVYRSIFANARRETHHHGMPLSIDVLKSVSRVHKHHMMVERSIKIQEEDRTFTERLQDMFGLRDYFAGEDSLNQASVSTSDML